MMNGGKNDTRSLAMMVLSLLIFGSIGIFRRWIPLSSAFLAFSRGILGGLFILAFLKLSGKGGKERIPFRPLLRLAFTGALIGFNWILLFEAYNHTTVAIATLCYYMQPTIVVLLSPAFFGEKLTAKKAACAAAAILGMVLVSGVAGGASGSGDARGILFGLGAAVLYSAVVILNKKTGGINAYRKTAVQLLSAGTVMILYLLLTGETGDGGFRAEMVFLLLIVGIVHTGIAYALYFGSMDGLRVQSIAILSYIDPVSALLFAAVFLKEPLNAAGIAGAVLIIGSAIVSEIPDGGE